METDGKLAASASAAAVAVAVAFAPAVAVAAVLEATSHAKPGWEYQNCSGGPATTSLTDSCWILLVAAVVTVTRFQLEA